MNMIGHPVYPEHFMFVILNDAGDVLIEPVFPYRLDECKTVFNSKYKLNMKLGVGVRHVNCLIMNLKKLIVRL